MTTDTHTIDTRRAITIRPPWAAAIILGLKPVENRTWPTRFRGRLYIHVGKQEDPDGMQWMATYLKEHAPGFADHPLWHARGGIIGYVEVTDCDAENTSEPFEIAGCYHWRLKNPVAVPFEKCLGAQQIWRIGDKKKVVELPEGFVVKSSKTGEGFTAKLYYANAFLDAFAAPDRITAQRLAAERALKIQSLPTQPELCTCCE